MMKPLRLGRNATPSANPQPPAHGPVALRDVPESPTASDMMPDVQLAYRNDGALHAPRPAPSPPFRLLPPTAAPSRIESVYTDDPRRRASGGMLSPPHDPMRAMLPDRHPVEQLEDDRGNFHAQLRSRPLNHSFLGQKIVALLLHPWVVAPSGLLACVFPDDQSAEDITDVEGAINLLSCGTRAMAHAAAGVLALHNPDPLNALLRKAGISPLVARPAPVEWGPLMARSPADFLLAGFKPEGEHK